MQNLNSVPTHLQSLARKLGEITPYVDQLYSRQKGDGSERGAFYPPDCTADEIRTAAASNPDLLKHDTVVRRSYDGSFIAVPYYQEYRPELLAINKILLQAARMCPFRQFGNYLTLRAASLLTGDDYDCDVAWVGANDTPFELIVGPMETYLDRFMGVKCSYESCIVYKDSLASARLDEFLDARNRLADRFTVLRASHTVRDPILTVGTALWVGGEMKAIKVRGCSLPNNPRVRDETGVKLTLFKDVIAEQVQKVILPVCRRLFGADAIVGCQSAIEEGYLSLIQAHEICHNTGLFTDASQRLRRAGVALEECKATVLSALCADILFREGTISDSQRRGVYFALIGFALMNIHLAETQPAREPYRVSDTRILDALLGETAGLHLHGNLLDYNVETGMKSLERFAESLLAVKARGTEEDAHDLLANIQNRTLLDDLCKKVSDINVE